MDESGSRSACGAEETLPYGPLKAFPIEKKRESGSFSFRVPYVIVSLL
jgi:hypothetical protein